MTTGEIRAEKKASAPSRRLHLAGNALRWKGATPWMLLAPALALIIVFTLGPTLVTLLASLSHISLIEKTWTFIGLENYREAINSEEVWQAARNTLIFSVLTIGPSVAIGLGLALLVDSFSRGRAVLRTLLFLPMTANLVAMSIVFSWIFAYRGGFANSLLAVFGVGPLNFLADASTALPTVAALEVWRASSFNMVIYLAGLTTIPLVVHEAAAVDGLRGWAKFRRVLWPLLGPSTVFVTVITVIGAFQVFDSISIMTDGGPLGATETVLYLVYRLGFRIFRFGYASALAFLLLAVTVLLGLARARVLARTELR